MCLNSLDDEILIIVGNDHIDGGKGRGLDPPVRLDRGPGRVF